MAKARSVTPYDLANRFNIRMSVARRILREKEAKGEVIPYVRESGFVVYTTPAEIQKREGGVPIMISDALAEVASSVSAEPVITEEMEMALLAAGTPGAVKPSMLARKRREAGEKKARKDTRPEVIVEPLDIALVRGPEHALEATKSIAAGETAPVEEISKKAVEEEKPKKEAPKKAAEKKESPKKAAEKKAAAKKEEKPKKEAPKKAAEKKEAPKKAAAKKEEKPKKEAPKKADAKREEKPKKATSKKKSE